MTTVARGRCTSAPEPVASAIGRKPSDATRAVIKPSGSQTVYPASWSDQIAGARTDEDGAQVRFPDGKRDRPSWRIRSERGMATTQSLQTAVGGKLLPCMPAARSGRTVQHFRSSTRLV